MDFTTTEATNDLGGLVAHHHRVGVHAGAPARNSTSSTSASTATCGRKLIDADVLSTAAPESLGGGGFGVLEQVAVLAALGRQLAAVPYLESVVLAAGALAKFGSEALQRDWAAPAVNGEKILTVALDGEMGEGPVQAHGERRRVPADRHPDAGGYGPVADAFLVPAETDSGIKVFLVAADDPGVTVTSLNTTGHGSVGAARAAGRRGRRRPASSAAREVVELARPRRQRWAAAHFSSACSSARWS